MRSIDRAVKKKTVDEVIACIHLLPVFSVINPTVPSTGEVVTSSQTVTSNLTPKTPPATRITDSERRTRFMHTENLSTPSIFGMLNGNNFSGVSEPASALLKEKGVIKEQAFDADQLTKAWKEFADTVDAAQLRSALSVREPFLTDNFKIGYNLDNEVQRQRIILDLKPKLLAYLNKILHNDQISIEFNVTENLEEIMNKPYTDQEKFNSLVAKYPVLGIMKQRFGLDFE